MKYYNIVLGGPNQDKEYLYSVTGGMGVECKWTGVLQTWTGCFNTFRAALTDEQLVVLKLAVNCLRIDELRG